MNLFDIYKNAKCSKVPDIVNKLGLNYEVFITEKEYKDLISAQEVFKGSRVILHKTLKKFLGKDYEGYILEKLKNYYKELPLQILNVLDEFYNKYNKEISDDANINHFYILAPYRGFTKSGLAKPDEICIVYSYFNVYIEVWNGDISLEAVTTKQMFKDTIYYTWDNLKEFLFEDFHFIKRAFYIRTLVIIFSLLSILNIFCFNSTNYIPDQVVTYIILNIVFTAPFIIYLTVTLHEKYVNPLKHILFVISCIIILDFAFLNYKWPKLEGVYNWESQKDNVIKIKIYKDKPLVWDRIE